MGAKLKMGLMAKETKTQKEHRTKRKMNPKSLANLKLWEKGESANPKGNHTGTPHRSTSVKKWTTVESEFPNPIAKQQERMSVRDAMTLAMIGEVLLNKSVAAYKALNEEEFGKTAQDVNLSGNLTIKTFAELALEAEREMDESER